MAHEHGRAPAGAQALGHEPACAQVEVRLGLVQHQQVGIRGQRPGQQDQSPLTARELAHAPRLGHAAQPELAEQVGDQRSVGLLGGRQGRERVVVGALETVQAVGVVRRLGQLTREPLELELCRRAVERVRDRRVEPQQLAIVLRQPAQHEPLLAHDLARVGLEIAGQKAQQRGLAAAVRPDDRELRTLVDG